MIVFGPEENGQYEAARRANRPHVERAILDEGESSERPAGSV